MSSRLRLATGLSILLLATASLPGCDMHRWVYVQIRSVPKGAAVHSKGLPSEHRIKGRATPTGHYLPCTPIGEKPDLAFQATHWSYVLKRDNYNDEQVFVERSAVVSFCADSKEDAKAKPFRVDAKMVAITSEQGLKNTVKITSTPPGVSIYDVGTKDLLGKTPARVTFTFFAPYKVGRLIELRLPGYQNARRMIHVRSINLHVHMLRPGERPRPFAPPPKRKVRKAPPPKGPATPSPAPRSR